jgi:hypothetical protein
MIGHPGIPLSDPHQSQSYDIDSKADREALTAFGITISTTGRRNRALLENTATPISELFKALVG